METLFEPLINSFDEIKGQVLGALVAVLPAALLIFGAYLAIMVIKDIVECIVFEVTYKPGPMGDFKDPYDGQY